MSPSHEEFESILRNLVSESKFVKAIELVDEMGLRVPEDIEIDIIRSRVDALNQLRAVCLSDDGWNVQRESEDLRTLYRNLEGTPHIHSIRLDGDVDAPLFTLLTLFHEIDLFPKWIPSYSLLGLSFARLIGHPSPTELLVHLSFHVPWPFESRYTFFRCDGIDCMDDAENPQIAVILNNLTSEQDNGVEDSGVKTTFYAPSGVLLSPLGGGRTRVQIVVNVDPQIPLVPDWLIDFAVRNLAFLIIYQIRHAVEIVKKDEEYQRRSMDGSSAFYNHVKRRFRESWPQEAIYLPDFQHQDETTG
jgi:hypothetical protein